MRTRTTRPNVSYREDDFEEERGDDNFEQSSDEDQIAVASTSAPRQRRQHPVKESHVPKTRHRPKVSYTEQSSAEEDQDNDGEDLVSEPDSEPGPRRAAKGRWKASTASKQIRSNAPKKRQPTRRKPTSQFSLRIGAPKKAVQFLSIPIPPMVSDGHVPQWHTLPYEILRMIFAHAAGPLLHITGSALEAWPNSEITQAKWLVEVACLCQNFAEPALHALYECPPIDSAVRGIGLVTLLRKSRDGITKLKYHTKIRKVRVELNVLGPTIISPGQMMLQELLTTGLTPQVHEIELWDREDRDSTKIPNQRSVRAFYPKDFATMLNSDGRRITSWHWHGTCLQRTSRMKQSEREPKILPNTVFPALEYEMFRDVHDNLGSKLRRLEFAYIDNYVFCLCEDTKALQGLEPDLEIYYQVLDTSFLENRPDDDSIGPKLAISLHQLEALEEIHLRACIMRVNFLQAINTPLKRLHIENCNGVRSEGLAIYLASLGSKLEELILEHNIDLDLGFLTVLADSCPKLKVLKMNFKYFSELIVTNMTEPGYDRLLTADQTPTWPPTLQELDLQFMHSWDDKAATIFFQSLVSAAKDLPDLRKLVISASIDMSWRDRANFRDSWIRRLKRVFQRTAPPPDPELQSLKAYRLWKEREEKINAGIIKELSHIAVTPKKRNQPMEIDSNDEETASSSRKRKSAGTRASRRIKDRKVSNETPVADPGPSLNLKDAVNLALEAHIQGLCDIVDIRIDNSRPSENQFTEGDFRDEEPSDDDDYDDVQGDAFTSDL